MNFTIVDCMFIIHDMDHLNKSLKLKLNITCDISHDDEEIKQPEVKVEEVKEPEVKVPEIKKVIKKEIIKKEVEPEIKEEEVKVEVKKGPKTPAERQRERRARLKEQLGEEEFKKQNQKRMKEYRAKQKEEEIKEEESEDVDDDNVSTTSSTNNNIKMLTDETKITCECGICYHKSYKTRHLKSKAHLEGLQKKQEAQEDIEIDDKNDKLRVHKNYVRKISDIDGKTIMKHPKINDCYDEITRYINMFVDDRINERQLEKNVQLSIKDFMDENNIKYKVDLFKDYEYESEFDSESESE